MHLSKNEINRGLYARRKEQHLCTLCGNPMDREGCMCLQCLEKHNNRYRKVKNFRRSSDESEKINGEIWMPIDGYPSHEVSNKGRVRNKKSNRLLKTYIRSQYKTVSIRKPNNKIAETLRVHRLVAMAFISNPNQYPHVNHIDGDKMNNNVENLEWCTPSMNIKHAFRIGLKKPIDHPNKRPVMQIDKNGNVVSEYPSIAEAFRQTGIRHISDVARSQKTAGGYYWKYVR